jgi:iron complex outermembrane receptor protein
MKNKNLYAASSLLLVLIQSFANAAQTDIDPMNSDVSMVLTPTRLRQSLSDVPGSVTVLTADMLTQFGIRSVPEALRLVPGMAVVQVSGSDYRISYHGTNISAPRRMNVLIDGVSVYRSAFARVDWTALPVAMADIQRIEVTRDPDSASYGPNSMLATINIITKYPQEVPGTTLDATAGSRRTADGMARYSGKVDDSTTYRVTVEHQQNLGFNNVIAPPNVGPTADPDHDASRLNKITFRSMTDIAPNQTFDLELSVLQGKQDNQVADTYTTSFPDVYLQEYDANAIWKDALSDTHELQVQAYLTQHRQAQSWNECLPTLAFLPQMGALYKASPTYVNEILAGIQPSGGTPTDNLLAAAAIRSILSLGPAALAPSCGTANQDYTEQRADIEFQDTYVFSPSLRMVSGAGLRRDIATSQTYLDGTVGNTTWRAFANVEYKPVPTVVINAGGYYEKDQLTGSSFSPRIALNKHLDDNNTIRFVVSKADRMPDIIEQRANWAYQVTNLSPLLYGLNYATFAQSATAPGNISAEHILSREIGYNGNFSRIGLTIDAKIFDDYLSDLISQRLILNSFAPTNSNDVTLRGAELQADYTPSQSWMMHAGYSYLLNSASTAMEQTMYSRNSGSVAVSHVFDSGWRASVGLYEYQATLLGQSGYGKQDVTVSKTYKLSRDSSITPTFTVTHLDHRSTEYMYGAGLSTENSYASPWQYYLSTRITF